MKLAKPDFPHDISQCSQRVLHWNIKKCCQNVLEYWIRLFDIEYISYFTLLLFLTLILKIERSRTEIGRWINNNRTIDLHDTTCILKLEAPSLTVSYHEGSFQILHTPKQNLCILYIIFLLDRLQLNFLALSGKQFHNNYWKNLCDILTPFTLKVKNDS